MGPSTQPRTGPSARVTGASDPGMTRDLGVTGDLGEVAVADQVGEEELLAVMW